MSEQEHDSDRSTASDRVPIESKPAERDHLDRISLTRRQSRTIVPPRKWRKIGLRQIICPECRAVVASIQDGFWHLQTTHNQGKGVDLEAWGQELRDELDEYIDAAQGRHGLVEDTRYPEIGHMTFVLFGLLVTLIVLGVIWATLHQ